MTIETRKYNIEMIFENKIKVKLVLPHYISESVD